MTWNKKSRNTVYITNWRQDGVRENEVHEVIRANGMQVREASQDRAMEGNTKKAHTHDMQADS